MRFCRNGERGGRRPRCGNGLTKRMMEEVAAGCPEKPLIDDKVDHPTSQGYYEQ